jgi:excisionase family DNA binding protein
MILVLAIVFGKPDVYGQDMEWGYEKALFIFTVYDAKTDSQLTTGHYSYNATVSSNGLWYGSTWQQQYSGNYDFKERTFPVQVTWRFPNASPMSFTCNWTVTINVPGFEQNSISGTTSLERELTLFGTPNVGSNAINQKVFLTPLKKDVELSGNLNVDLKPSADTNHKNSGVGKEKSNTFDIFSAEEIADFLDIEVKDVLALINKKKLKAKKIGETYFIRKKDFDAFMEK